MREWMGVKIMSFECEAILDVVKSRAWIQGECLWG